MHLRQEHNGVVEAGSTSPNNHSNKLVHIQYRDHIEFKNASHKFYFDVNVREAVGWVVLETDEFLFLIYDRSVESLPYEGFESGLILIKARALECLLLSSP